MQITAICPHCRSRFQLAADLVGKNMRCPNQQCREIFQVTPTDTSLERNDIVIVGGKVIRTGSVGDIVPILQAEQVTPRQQPDNPPTSPEHVSNMLPLVPAEVVESADPPQESPRSESWREAPPPIRAGDEESAPKTVSSPPRNPVVSPEPPTNREASDWRTNAPPVVGEKGEQAARPTPPIRKEETDETLEKQPPTSGKKEEKSKTKKASSEKPKVLARGEWDAPPVRDPTTSPASEKRKSRDDLLIPDDPARGTSSEVDSSTAGARRRTARRWMIGIVLGALLVLGGAAGVAWIYLSQSEEELFAQAKQAYDEGHFLEATAKLESLLKKFPNSPHLEKYQFLRQLAELRQDAAGEQLEITGVLDRVDQFIEQHRDTPLLDEFARDLGQTLAQRMEKFLEREKEKDDPALAPTLDLIVQHLERMNIAFPESIEEQKNKHILEHIDRMRKKISLAVQRLDALDKLRAMIPRASADTIVEARAFIEETEGRLPGFKDDPAIPGILADLYARHKKNAVYLPIKREMVFHLRGGLIAGPYALDLKLFLRHGSGQAEDSEPFILVDPLVAGESRDVPAGTEDRVVLALVRGVLYGLSAASGQIRWALRVGIDTSQLPLRLPPTSVNPRERFLVLSADTRTLMALEVKDDVRYQLWKHHLSAPSLGRPIIVGPLAYVATDDGKVHVIEHIGGRVLGRYDLGQSLSVGGVYDAVSKFLYVPADHSCVYVLNLVTEKCEAILYTNHPSGSLRSEPLLIGGLLEGQAPPGATLPTPYLLLNQTIDLDTTQLRIYKLPIKSHDAKAIPLQPEARLRGWTWFPPYHDSEKVVVVTAPGGRGTERYAARLGLFGILQVRNKDNPLFPLVPVGTGGEAGIDLRPYLKSSPEDERGRAMVAHVQGEEFWVLAHGRLQRLALRLGGSEGPYLESLWQHLPLELGSPYHRGQVLEGRNGPELYLVTEPLNQRVSLVTAIDLGAPEPKNAEHEKRILWKRQLGMVCRGEPMVLGEEVLAVDQGGGLFRFTAKSFHENPGGQELVGGQMVAKTLEDRSSFDSQLLPRSDGKGVWQIIAIQEGRLLKTRTYQSPAEGQTTVPPVAEEEVRLSGASLAGNVAVVGDSLLVPLSNGDLVRYSLPLKQDSRAALGPTWRTRGLGAEARCHVAVLSKDEFVITDGGRGLRIYRWRAEDREATLLTVDMGRPRKVELPDRPASAPLVLPANGKNPLRLFVADVRGNLHLLQGERLQLEHTWDLKGKSTSVPILLGTRIACVVDGQRLVCVDPSTPGSPPWTHDTGGEGIVGHPRLIENMIVVCDEGGRFVGLNPVTGQLLAPGYTLKAVVGPAASCGSWSVALISFATGPGTIMLLSLDQLRKK